MGYLLVKISLKLQWLRIGEQVNDILFARETVTREMPFADRDNTGLLSWSLGGTAIVKAAMLAKDIKCILSFDGTETHYYGLDTAWDREFDKIKQLSPYAPQDISAPYLYIGSNRTGKIDSVYVFFQHVHTPPQQLYFLRLNNASHEDFSSMPSIIKTLDTSLKNINKQYHDTICRLSQVFFDQYLKGKGESATAGYITRLRQADATQYITGFPDIKKITAH